MSLDAVGGIPVLAAMIVAAAWGCGARTDPLTDDSVDDELRPRPAANGCTSAVSGSTPMRGYCSTRACLAPYDAPRAPVTSWMVQLATDFEPIEIVVDTAGRTYATIDPIRGDSALVPQVLVALDARGRMTMQHDFRPETVGNLFLAADGTLRATAGRSPRSLVRIEPGGTVTTLGTLPEHSLRFAVASDGTLVTTITDFHSPDHLARVAPDGAVLWTSPQLDDGTCGGCLSDVALFSDDRVVVAEITVERGTTVRCLDAHGAIAWERHVDGILTQGPAIAADATVRLVTGVTDPAGLPATIVTALSSSGEVLWQTRLAEDYQQTWENALVVAGDGATFVHSFHALTAIEPGGAVRWRIDAPTNLSYDAVVDSHGTLVAMLGAIRGLDAATGEERWHVDGPGFVGATLFYVSNLALASTGCLLGASHGGMLFAACDP